MKIRARLTIMMIILLNVVIIVTGVIVSLKSWQVINHLATNSALELTSAQDQIISGYIDKEFLLIDTLTSEKNIVDLLMDKSNASKVIAQNNKFIEYVEDKPNLEGVILVDTNGRIISSSNTSSVGLDLSERQYHKSIVSTKAPVISEILVSKYTGNQIFMAAKPVFDLSTNKMIGYIANVVTAESMATSLRKMKLSGAKSSYAYLVDEKGNLLYHPDSDKIGKSLEQPEILKALSDMQNGVLSSTTIVHYKEIDQKLISACSLIPQTKWMLVIVGNMSEFEAPIRKMNSFVIIFIVIVNIITTIVAFFLAKQISSPIIINLKSKNDELTSLYEELTASEEELREQFDELSKSREIILDMAYHDALTHLPNRTFLMEKLNALFIATLEYSRKVVVMFLDLDNFKTINDTLGHSVGDAVLIETAKRLQSRIKSSDMIARLSGDEFAVVIANYTKEELILVINNIINSFHKPFYVNDLVLNITASVGVSIYPDDGNTVEELLRNADTAMYKAKELGKNTYQFYSHKMKEELVQKTNMERMLRNAIDRNEFVLHYQPQYDLNTNKLRGFEALIRWNSSEIGFINPMDFIPLAEETGLIVPIGDWVLKNACMTCKKLMEENHCTLIMSVNISAIQLKNENIYETIMDCIKVSGIAPQNLELEVTESVFVGNDDQSLIILRKLKEAGIRIALDDFGTGYSSLSYLQILPISLLKIDKSFICESNKNQNLAENIISLAHKLNIETIAEGVETKEQLNYLKESGCDNLQGFYFSKPVPDHQIGELLHKSTSDF